MAREQGVSKDGARRLRARLTESALFWLRFQPESALARRFRGRVNGAKGASSRS
jgi:transposase